MGIRLPHILWILCLAVFLVPWARGSTGMLFGFNLLPFTIPYIVGLAIGFPPIVTRSRRALLTVLASIFMLWGALNVALYWYSLALHYVATGGGVAEILPGTWIALITALAYLITALLPIHKTRK